MTRLATVLLGIAAVGGAIWWYLLLTRPQLGAAFLPPGVPPDLIDTFVLPDFVFYVACPAVSAAGFAAKRPWARTALLLHCGAACYAALWGWGTVLATGGGLVGALAMTPSAVVFPWLAWRLARNAK